MTRARCDRTFSSLAVPNYRRYFAGQVVSISGNWMQIVAEMWLVVQLTGSGAAVGITAGLQFLPVLLFGAWGGVLADRFDKRTLLTITQLCMALPALALWGLTAGGAIEAWMVFALVLARGTVTAIDNPARQAFVIGDGRRRARRQRGRAELGDRALGAHRRARRRPAALIALLGVARLLRGQRGHVPRDGRRAAADGPGAAAARRARAARAAASCARRSPTCAARRRCGSRWR